MTRAGAGGDLTRYMSILPSGSWHKRQTPWYKIKMLRYETSFKRGGVRLDPGGEEGVIPIVLFRPRPHPPCREREFFIDSLLVRIHFIIEMIRWTGLAPWELEFPFPGSLTSTFLEPAPALPTPPQTTVKTRFAPKLGKFVPRRCTFVPGSRLYNRL